MMGYQFRQDPDAIFVFANTGKEMPQTLDFVRDCALHWDVEIVWLEYRSGRKFERVDYDTASRNGEPFADLIKDKKMLPNPCARFCTSELKVLTIDRYMKSIGHKEYETAVGIRADEPRRVVKMRQKENYFVPLADQKITKSDVIEFWDRQPFDLNLPFHGDFSNCDLCFLKRSSLKKSIADSAPERVTWWAEQERKSGYRFRVDHPSYDDLRANAGKQTDLFGADDETIACFCGD